ncbi:MAG: acyl-CoA reductase [Candidatus Asgardarchaeia archaeon]
MSKVLKGYYLPPSLKHLEERLEYEELQVEEYTILKPKITANHVKEIIKTLKENRDELLSDFILEEIAIIFDNVTKKWHDNNYEKKKIAMRILPLLTNLSPELIEYYQFRTLYKINKDTILFLGKFELPEEVFKKFIKIKESGTMLKGFASMLNKMKRKKALKNMRDLKLITYITPSNVPGLIECLGIFLAAVVRAASIIKSPSIQPVFAPLYAESIFEENRALGETIAVIPWKGGTLDIENELFKNSDAVSVVSSTETAMSVKKRIDELNKKGYHVKGCYHGGKFGLEVISKEYANKDVAGLSVIDGIGYEGYMCSSPAFGFFVEKGGKVSAQKYAEFMAEEAELISKRIPQRKYFKALREKEVAKIMASEGMNPNVKIFTSPNQEFTVVYEPEPTLKPIGQNRLFRVMPINDIFDILQMLKPWKTYLQSIGIAIPDNRLIQFAEKAGKTGLTNIRIVGTLTLPRLGESWDGNLPISEFYVPDLVRWVSINTLSVDEEIPKLIEEKNKLIEHGVFHKD